MFKFSTYSLPPKSTHSILLHHTVRTCHPATSIKERQPRATSSDADIRKLNHYSRRTHLSRNRRTITNNRTEKRAEYEHQREGVGVGLFSRGRGGRQEGKAMIEDFDKIIRAMYQRDNVRLTTKTKISRGSLSNHVKNYA